MHVNNDAFYDLSDILDIHPVVVFIAEAPVSLQNLVESGLHAVLAAAQRVAVVV